MVSQRNQLQMHHRVPVSSAPNGKRDGDLSVVPSEKVPVKPPERCLSEPSPSAGPSHQSSSLGKSSSKVIPPAVPASPFPFMEPATIMQGTSSGEKHRAVGFGAISLGANHQTLMAPPAQLVHILPQPEPLPAPPELLQSLHTYSTPTQHSQSASAHPGEGDRSVVKRTKKQKRRDMHESRKRFVRTAEALKQSGLLALTMKTATLIKENRKSMDELAALRKQAEELLQCIMENPENQMLKPRMLAYLNYQQLTANIDVGYQLK